ncbi:hypothetical protein K7I13_13770 [Brucepastera parasyntrophica]|uniref:hypothetical protein n=1 Tax=Brucepastera parasyntrophica TaxID=2880008 RepID=UPI00210F201F|nr:hypothetical protein [Brucepastera parasyntrophica]ULQ59517.1 hypothetical protein K7I13_13770 [Brucepastera parasyntrophica]
MCETTSAFDEKYRQIFEEETRGLHRRKNHDPECTIEDIEGILRSLYIIDGNDVEGRGQLQDTAVSATIAAYEHFLAEWKKELTV